MIKQRSLKPLEFAGSHYDTQYTEDDFAKKEKKSEEEEKKEGDKNKDTSDNS